MGIRFTPDDPPGVPYGTPGPNAPAPHLTADEVRAVRFSPTSLREGYDQSDVDAFLDRVEATLRAREADTPATVDPLTATDVVGVSFRPTRFRAGYDQSEVDAFLDRVVVALRDGR